MKENWTPKGSNIF
jgi:hypothetical protein